MENHHFQWENSRFLWPFSIAMLNYQRVHVAFEPQCLILQYLLVYHHIFVGLKRLQVLPGQVSKVCGCLTATYIGGSANLAEVAFDSGLAKEGGGILACLAAADVLLMCFYFAGLVLVPGSIAV
jgi:uncharacterized membrane protein